MRSEARTPRYYRPEGRGFRFESEMSNTDIQIDLAGEHDGEQS